MFLPKAAYPSLTRLASREEPLQLDRPLPASTAMRTGGGVEHCALLAEDDECEPGPPRFVPPAGETTAADDGAVTTPPPNGVSFLPHTQIELDGTLLKSSLQHPCASAVRAFCERARSWSCPCR
jgi:hypothetical protein